MRKGKRTAKAPRGQRVMFVETTYHGFTFDTGPVEPPPIQPETGISERVRRIGTGMVGKERALRGRGGESRKEQESE